MVRAFKDLRSGKKVPGLLCPGPQIDATGNSSHSMPALDPAPTAPAHAAVGVKGTGSDCSSQQGPCSCSSGEGGTDAVPACDGGSGTGTMGSNEAEVVADPAGGGSSSLKPIASSASKASSSSSSGVKAGGSNSGLELAPGAWLHVEDGWVKVQFDGAGGGNFFKKADEVREQAQRTFLKPCN